MSYFLGMTSQIPHFSSPAEMHKFQSSYTQQDLPGLYVNIQG